jgi:hypothetical protein
MSGQTPMGPDGGGRDESADARMGMVQVNDLVYRLETDLSVAINRTHKINYFQNIEYNDKQTSIIILNSGSDYIDPRRSFLSFDINIPETNLDLLTKTSKADQEIRRAFISCYFGENGSVLNLIDSVVVSTRSGDEVSRVNDYGQLMNMLLPQMFGKDWRRTIGQGIGLGSYLGGSNNAVDEKGASAPAVSEQRRRRFTVPLYLLSPIFNYGRLLPSMLMSGLRIEIKWKPLVQACQQFWENCPVFPVATGPEALRLPLDDQSMTAFQEYFDHRKAPGDLMGGMFAAFDRVGASWEFTQATGELKINVGTSNPNSLTPGSPPFGFLAYDNNYLTQVPPVQVRIFQPGTIFEWYSTAGFRWRFVIQQVTNATTAFVTCNSQGDATGDWNNEANANPLIAAGPYILSPHQRPVYFERRFGQLFNAFRHQTGTVPLQSYTITSPQVSLCSVMLTDAIQRTLNEYSATNGLEIVYADYDRTSQPISPGTQSIYCEIRKSASRALAVFGRLVNSSVDPHTYDSFASCYGSYWNSYQFQLGSLYFPNQPQAEKHSDPDIARDNEASMIYMYAEDAFDRLHSKAAPTMASLRGDGIDFNFIYRHPTEVHGEHSPSTYLKPPSDYGKWGSAVNGATTVATSLERSSLFELSGIPVNNSRVLAIRGEAYVPTQATLMAFLKYVRLIRVFLVNCEVEQ